MPFARIDLEWLDGSEYHRFILWMVPKISGVDGFNGLEQGQLRFSRRDLERDFKVGSTRASNLIEKAIKNGLIMPLRRHLKRHGMGEIYEVRGELRDSRFEPKPRANQEQTKSEPTNLLNNKDLTLSINQDQTKSKPRANRLKDKTKKTINTCTPLEEKLEDILDWNDQDWKDVFFEVFKPFPPDKKKNFYTLAKQFRSAVRDEGATPEAIHAAVGALCGSVSNKQYLPDASKWMAERGWMAYASR